MNEYTELEYKYKADDVPLKDFIKLMSELKTVKRLDVSSWDSYYTKGEDEFVRHRQSQQKPELTIKRKTKDTNNWQRVEVDIALDPSVSEDNVSKFLSLLDYKFNFKIYKSCFIFWLDNVNYVYYIVYDEDMKERGRFIEVEVNKDRIEYLFENAIALGLTPISALSKAEEALTQVNISSKNRTKKSLYEMFVK